LMSAADALPAAAVADAKAASAAMVRQFIFILCLPLLV
jgi:hypothetical protein